MTTATLLAVDNLVCDLDGVVYRGGRGVPGVGRVLEAAADAGVHILFATNNSTATPGRVAAKIASSTGFRARADQVVTSSIAAADLVRDEAGPALVVGEPGIERALAGVGIGVTDTPERAGLVVVGLDRRLTYDRLRLAAAAIFAGARFVATNTDASFPVEDGLWPGGGAIVAALERATGRDAEVAGKPNAPMREALERRLGPGRTAVVGDRPETDLALGIAAGWERVLVLTGVVDNPEAVPREMTPDVVVPSLADLTVRPPA
ncbi:MAG: HAD-IIA family hydrolase [Acidimicrobiia bacterium]|nr:HAD-IIA family hydrolase [Acidimicrobiia bacterium]